MRSKILLFLGVFSSFLLLSILPSFADEGVDLKELPALSMPQDAALGEGLQTEISKKEIEALIPWAKSTRDSMRDGLKFVDDNEVQPRKQVERLMSLYQDIVKTSSPQASEMLFRYLINRSLKLIEVDSTLTGANAFGGDWARRAEFLKMIGAQSLTFLEDELKWMSGLTEDTKLKQRDLAGFGIKNFTLMLNYSRQIINARAQAKSLWLAMAWLRQDLYGPEQRESTQKFARDIIAISNVLKTVQSPDAWAADLDDEDHLANYRALLSVALQIQSVAVKSGVVKNDAVKKPGKNELGMDFVPLPNGLEMQTTEVTQGQWKAVMGSNPSEFGSDPSYPGQDAQLPVEKVNWNEAQDFAVKVTLKLKDGYTYRLPTEDEWEIAARAGTTTTYSFGDDENQLADYAWFEKNAQSHTHTVATRKANAWGLYDMHGNVWEWTQTLDGSYRVLRGGCWARDARALRSAYRSFVGPSLRYYYVGFRLVRTR